MITNVSGDVWRFVPIKTNIQSMWLHGDTVSQVWPDLLIKWPVLWVEDKMPVIININSQMSSLKNCSRIQANNVNAALICCLVLFLILSWKEQSSQIRAFTFSVSVHFNYFTESLHLICGEHFSLRYEDQHGSTGEGIKATGRQTGGRQIKTALLVSAHCATLISL